MLRFLSVFPLFVATRYIFSPYHSPFLSFNYERLSSRCVWDHFVLHDSADVPHPTINVSTHVPWLNCVIMENWSRRNGWSEVMFFSLFPHAMLIKPFPSESLLWITPLSLTNLNTWMLSQVCVWASCAVSWDLIWFHLYAPFPTSFVGLF